MICSDSRVILEAIFRDEHSDRYDDRLIVETNFVESYDLLTGFIAKHTNDKFFLIDGATTSVRDIISREIVGNVLVHCEFSSAFPTKIIIEPDRILTENWNRPQFPGKIDPASFTPYPKNPIIAKFFVNIGLADTFGSGTRNLYACSRIYCGDPAVYEDFLEFLSKQDYESLSVSQIPKLYFAQLDDYYAPTIRFVASLTEGEFDALLAKAYV